MIAVSGLSWLSPWQKLALGASLTPSQGMGEKKGDSSETFLG